MIFTSFIPRKKKADSSEQKDAPSVSSTTKTSVVKKKASSKRGLKRRVVHTKRSFHRPALRPIAEQVRVFDVLDRPLVTEKAAYLSERGVYVFLVRPFATKHSVRSAIETIYGVIPEKVRIARYPSRRKRVRVRGRERELTSLSMRKRAYVYLKSGEKITLF